MNASEARALGNQLVEFITTGMVEKALQAVEPVLAAPTAFALLDRVGDAVGTAPLVDLQPFLDRIAAGKSMGGWVIIASALSTQLAAQLARALSLSREYIIQADVWYATDTFGERVVGQALVGDFQRTSGEISTWRFDPNRWVRRSVGVAIHYWAKRSRGDHELAVRAREILCFLEPTLEERNQDVVKGIGWGLKTLGRYYPDLATDWLEDQLIRQHKKPRAITLRKAMTYLSPEQRNRLTGSS